MWITIKGAIVVLTFCLAPLMQAQAEDIDIFRNGASGASSRPNVLIVLDNTANWEPMFTAEMTALGGVISGLQDGVFNVGLMLMVETGGGNPTNDGGYVRFAVRPMGGAEDTNNYKAALVRLIGQLGINADKSNNAVYGLVMDEAYRYFQKPAGQTGGDSYSGKQIKRDYLGNTAGYLTNPVNQNLNAFASSTTTTYTSPVADGCQKNYIVLISNGKAGDNASATANATRDLATAGGNTQTITLNPNGFESNVADEWARFMGDKSTNTAKPEIHTYTILVKPDSSDTNNACQKNIPSGQYPSGFDELLNSMSAQGGGTAQTVRSCRSSDISTALNNAFQEIQAVNSVFASSSLPVALNERGTFLNQVYMGVFRPDGHGTPRWAGNLKEYQLATTVDSTGKVTSVFLADKNAKAIESPSTGFILPTATSAWTTSSSFWNQSFAAGPYNYADPVGIGKPTDFSTGLQSDAPDGALVEKGGAAQHLRTIYANSINDATSARKLYTCLGSCTAGTALSSVPFSTGNSSLTAALLGTSNAASVTITRAGATATAASSAAHGFGTGDSVVIAGATPIDYNGTKTITVTDATHFTYPIQESPPVSASGTITGQLAPSSGSSSVTNIQRTGTTATVTLPSNPFTNGQTVTITGANQPEYNGAFVIGNATPTSFTYTVPENPSATIGLATTGSNKSQACPNAGSLVTCPNGSPTQTISSMSRTPGDPKVTVVTSKDHGFATNSAVLIENVTPSAYDGTFVVTAAPSTVTNYKQIFYYNVRTTPASPATGTITATLSSAASVIGVNSMTRDAGTTVAGITTATVTGRTSVAHGWSTGQQVILQGANESAYNGTFTLTSDTGCTTGGTTFCFRVTVGPDNPTGPITATKAGNVDANELIDWVRGENRWLDDNPSLQGTDVRGYLHGDVLHSRPAVINYGGTSGISVFYGGNDGILHSVQGGTVTDDSKGGEQWGFIAPDHFSKLSRLYLNSPGILESGKPYFFDGPLTAFTSTSNANGQLGSNDTAWLYATMRRGGRGIYAFNVINPLAPALLWKKANTDPGYSELGQTWSEVQPMFISGRPNPAVAFGLGYDSNFDDPSPQGASATLGRGIMVADAQTGDPIWVATGDSSFSAAPAVTKFVSGMCPVAADLALVDRNLDGKIDRIYAADTCGNIWRANINHVDQNGNADPNNWSVVKIAQLGGTGSNQRKFLFRPDVVFGPNFDEVLIGSGDREHPFDETINNAFYMIKDLPNLDLTAEEITTLTTDSTGPGGRTPARYPVTSDQLCDANPANCPNPVLKDLDNNPATPDVPTCDVSACQSGWKWRYSTTGEKTVNAPITLAGTVFFATNVPQSVVGANSCGGLGEARLYQLSDQDPSPKFYDASTGGYSAYEVRAGGGLPPSPVGVVVDIGGQPVDVVITGPHADLPPGPLLEKRYRLYWYKLIDRP